MTACDKCGAELHIGMFPFCPHGRPNVAIVDDSVDGHWCETLGHEDVWITSKTQLRNEAAARGLENVVRHDDSWYAKQRKMTNERYADERISQR